MSETLCNWTKLGSSENKIALSHKSLQLYSLKFPFALSLLNSTQLLPAKLPNTYCSCATLSLSLFRESAGLSSHFKNIVSHSSYNYRFHYNPHGKASTLRVYKQFNSSSMIIYKCLTLQLLKSRDLKVYSECFCCAHLLHSKWKFAYKSSAYAQHHRLVEVCRDLSRSCSPTPMLKQGQLEQVAQDHVQLGFEYLHWWRLRSLSGQPMPVFYHPHRKKVFSVQMEFCAF